MVLVMGEEEEEEGGGRGAATLLHPCAETDAGDVKPARGREHFFFLFSFFFFFFSGGAFKSRVEKNDLAALEYRCLQGPSEMLLLNDQFNI